MLDISGQKILYIYGILVLISVVYIFIYRQNLVKQHASATKRDNAIEKFQNYTHNAASTLFNLSTKQAKTANILEGFQSNNNSNSTNSNTNSALNQTSSVNTTNGLPSNNKNAILGANCNTTISPMPKIHTDNFLIPELDTSIHNRVNKQLIKKNQLSIINNIIDAVIQDIVNESNKIYSQIKDICTSATPANEFSQEERLDYYFTGTDIKQLTGQINNFINNSLETRLSKAFTTTQLLDTGRENNHKLLKREIYERVFAKLYENARLLLSKNCRNQSLLLQKLDTSSAGQLKYDIQTGIIQYRLLLLALTRLTENPQTVKSIQTEVDKLRDTVIQPAMETDLDTINTRNLGRLGMSINESNDVLSTALTDMPSKISTENLYQSYLENVAKRDTEMKIDPMGALDKLEKTTIGFLEQLGTELGNTSPSIATGNSSGNEYVNRFKSQPNNLGSYLVGKSNNNNNTTNYNRVSSNINTGSYISNNKNIRLQEGFSNSNDDIDSKDMLGHHITGWSKYVYDFVKDNFDSELTDKAEKILTDENNMVPLGILFIIGSIFLYFIDLSS